MARKGTYSSKRQLIEGFYYDEDYTSNTLTHIFVLNNLNQKPKIGDPCIVDGSYKVQSVHSEPVAQMKWKVTITGVKKTNKVTGDFTIGMKIFHGQTIPILVYQEMSEEYIYSSIGDIQKLGTIDQPSTLPAIKGVEWVFKGASVQEGAIITVQRTWEYDPKLSYIIVKGVLVYFYMEPIG